MSEGDLDSRFPGNMNYLDWLMNILLPDEFTRKNTEQLIDFLRQDRAKYEATGKVKAKAPTGELAKLFAKPKPVALRRPIRSA